MTEAGSKRKRANPGADLPPELFGERILRPAAAAAMLGTSPSQVYRLAEKGVLPPPVRLSHRVSGWSVADIRAAIEARRGVRR